jgi:outer membrane phospholipase A
MKKRSVIAVVVLLLTAGSLCAQRVGTEELRNREAFSAYEPTYLIAGLGDELVKLSFSAKYEPFYRSHFGLYLAYTQVMFWDLFHESSPFHEINYSPNLFYRFQSGYNIAGDVEFAPLEFVQLGWEHKSNGLDGPSSRGWDRLYTMVEVKVGQDFIFAANAKYFVLIETLFPNFYGDRPRYNQDIQQYIGSTEYQLRIGFEKSRVFVLPRRVILSFGPAGGKWGFDFLNGWQKVDVLFGNLFGVSPYLQIWHGRGESLIEYDTDPTLSIRAGISLN